MATTTVEFDAVPGATLTVDHYPLGNDTATSAGVAATEATNRKGTYSFTYAGLVTGIFEVHIKSGTDVIAIAYCYREDALETIRASDYHNVLGWNQDEPNVLNCGRVPAGAQAISGDTVAADNLEAAADGTGYNLGAGLVVAASVSGAVGSVTGAVGSLGAQAKLDVNVEADTALTDYGALKPTVAGRTLDRSGTGEAGVDWANVGSPTTVVVFSGTTVKTATDVEADTADIQARLPAALVSGRIDASVGAMAANVLTAAATAADFGTEVAAAVWDALTSGMVAVGSLGKKLADWVVGTIDTYTGNTKQTGDAFLRLGAPVAASVSADIATVQADTDNLQTRIPAALVGGRMDADLGAMQAGVVTAAAIADGAIDRATFAADTGLATIRSGIAQAGAAGTVTLDASASAVDDFYNDTLVFLTGGTGVGQVRRIRDYVGATKVATVVPNWVTNPDVTSTFAILPTTSAWDETMADHLDVGSTGKQLEAAGAAGDPWTTALPGAYGAGTAWKIVGDKLDAA